MTIGARSDVVIVAIAISLSWVGLTVGCNRERREAEQILKETAKSHEQLWPRLAALKASLSGLREEVEDLAAKVPGGAELRSKYFNADEVVGVLDAKMKWLSGEIESAKHDLKRTEVVTLRDAIAKTGDDIGQVSSVIVELAHEKAHLHRIGALLEAPYEHQLSTGYRVKSAKNGVESHLVDFIEDNDKRANKTTWFDFDRLQFEGEGSDLDVQGSRSQIENIAHILAAYPTVRLRIGGYTDNKGASAANRKVSAERAQAVKRVLVQSGVNPERLEAAGYGSKHSVCPASDSEICRARNGRIAALVIAK